MIDSVPQISTPRLLLRQIDDSDLHNIYSGLSNPAVIRHYGVSYSTLEGAKSQMDWYSSLRQNETGMWWAICSGDNKIFYGACGLNNLIKQHRRAEIGFWLLPPYWGFGYAVEAASEVCRFGFESLQLHRIEALVEIDNVNSAKILRKMSFEHEGTMRECELKNGVYISLDIYAKLHTV